MYTEEPNVDQLGIVRFFKTIKNLGFLSQIAFIFSTEYARYCWFNNYSSFIDRLSSRLASINILYVKLFQAFALNNQFIDETTNNNLLLFTDNAPWCLNDIDYYTLIQIGDEYNLIFKDGFERPINSGMISLVYKAYKRETNEPVIIKMKRNNIDEQLNQAVDQMLYCVDLLSFIPILKKYKLAQNIHKSTDLILDQTDFTIEVQNMITIKNNCANLKYVKIPNVVEEVTTKYDNIIMMEYIDGKTIDKINRDDYEEFAKQVVKFGLVTTSIHGVTHGDLHAGNVLFIKDEMDLEYPYKIGLLDFGIIYRLDKQYKETFFEIFTDLQTLPPCDICEKLFSSGIIEPMEIFKQLPKEHYNRILAIGTKVVNDAIFSSEGASQLHVFKFLTEFTEFLKNPEISRLGLGPSEKMIKSQVVLAMSHGITLTLCKDDYASVADKVLNELFHCDLLTDE